MIDLSTVDHIYLVTGYTDLRKVADGCSAIVQYDLNMNPFTRDIFLFCNRHKNTIQILEWDENGFWLHKKKLLGYADPFSHTEVLLTTTSHFDVYKHPDGFFNKKDMVGETMSVIEGKESFDCNVVVLWQFFLLLWLWNSNCQNAILEGCMNISIFHIFADAECS